MILKRSELYTPIIMLGYDKKYLSIGDSISNYLYPSANESYRFSLSENTREVNKLRANRVGYYCEGYGIMYDWYTNSILAMIVEDKNNVRYLIASNSLKDAHLTRAKQSAVSVFGVSRKNIILMSDVELSMNFIFNLEYSMSDLDKEVQQPIINEVLDEIRATLPPEIPSESIDTTVKDRDVFVAGDYVTILKGFTNWAGSPMDTYVGVVVQLKEDGLVHRFDFDGRKWQWCYKDGHFRRSTPDEIIEAKQAQCSVVYDKRPF